MSEHTEKKPELMRWALISALLICIAAAALLRAKADHLFNDEPSLTSEALARPADMRVLMLGNSLIYWHDTDVMLERLAASIPGGPRLVVGRIARPSYTLHDHYTALYADDLWHRWNVHNKVFRPFAAPSHRWDAVIVHERSMLAASVPIDDRALAVSAAPAETIYLNATAYGAKMIFMSSWGYMRGALPADEAWFKKNFPSFKEMNHSIDDGYTKIAAKIEGSTQLAAQQRGSTLDLQPIAIARVGRAFEQTWEVDAAAGRDPLAEGSLFRGLYDDPNHPSIAGAYLSAAVLLVTLTGQPCGAATWVPDGLDPREARRLRAHADAQLDTAPAPPPQK